ncbi:histone-lysine N-methyltransferase PRDM9-like isoform X1 [Scleropages formosus]|uniref:histone-lysine N-methyltransferase PRDM9-like isoform X1 n=2 Tax=Scleropages formosus TaxID=113540 RepID=UPI0010FA964E|nr:histone-lysine N-methyltransferase PRDM9-like isoform X1 [Scleropages formosus]
MRRRPLVLRVTKSPVLCVQKCRDESGMEEEGTAGPESSPSSSKGREDGAEEEEEEEGEEGCGPSGDDGITSDEEWHPSARGSAAGLTKRGKTERAREKELVSACSEAHRAKEEDPGCGSKFYCEECKSFYVDECETHGPPSFIPDSPAPLGAPQRALLTLPPGMMVSRSSIPEAGLGVFNQGETVPVGTHFGPYEGEVTTREEAIESSYSWVVCRKKNQFEYIDAKRDTHSNWMRYVNCARSEEEQNLVAFQHRGRVFYRCLRPILPGQELLLWHEDDYAKELGITWDYLWDKKCNPADRSTRAFPCTQCRFSFTAELYLNKHIKRSHSPIVKSRPRIRTGEQLHCCSECGQNFTLSCNLKRHERVSHTRERPFCCIECGQSFSQPIGLKRHQQSHLREKPYLCTECGRSFCWSAGLKRHQQNHTKEGFYLCTDCGKSFIQSGALKRHQQIHSGERQYLCTECGKSFTWLHSLRQHQRIHTGEKPYCCTQCGKSFVLSEQLKVHIRTHTGEKPFLCTECGESFRQSGDLKRHERKHTGFRPCHCSECGRSFSRPQSLKAHQLLHKGERPYHCSQCDKSFSRNGHLRRHHQKMHS